MTTSSATSLSTSGLRAARLQLGVGILVVFLSMLPFFLERFLPTAAFFS